ncbi:MAG: signal peptidase I [Coriobacteriia bacterium]|nr:signal peptidase I [Coriobacteriia bacterium]
MNQNVGGTPYANGQLGQSGAVPGARPLQQVGGTSSFKQDATAGTGQTLPGQPTQTPKPDQAVGTGQAVPTKAPGHTGPGTGIPNPNYTYRQKPPLLGTGLQRDILSLLLKIAAIAGIVLAMFTFIFGVFQYSADSMNPAVKSGDLVLFSRFDNNYNVQDLIVVRHQGDMQVRRIVASNGDTVDIAEGRLIVNGASQQEANIFTITNRYESEIAFPLTVPEGHVFVLGDNREGATDSRIYGTVPVDDSLGKVISLFRRRGL